MLNLLFAVLVLLKHLLQVLMLNLLSLDSIPSHIDVAVSFVFIDALSEFQIPLLTLLLVFPLNVLELIQTLVLVHLVEYLLFVFFFILLLDSHNLIRLLPGQLYLLEQLVLL